MKRYMDTHQIVRSILYVAFSVSLALPLPARAALVALATAPLASSTTTAVLPNLMFIIDNSGSMAWNYLPDWANDSLCLKVTVSGGVPTTTFDASCTNAPPFQSSDFNGVYYNPAISYLPALNADGTSKGSQTSWTAVNDDAFGIQSSSQTDLTQNYVDVEWCTDTSYTNCVRNDDYVVPGVVNGLTYYKSHSTTSNGSGLAATGPQSAPVTVARDWGPHYYTINPGEYCDSMYLTNCQSSVTAGFTFPAKIRWCNSETNATAANPAAGTCQALRTGVYTHVRFPTKFHSLGTDVLPDTPEVRATATFNLTQGSSNSCTSTKMSGILSIQVGSTTIMLDPSPHDYKNSASSVASEIRGVAFSGGYSVSGSNSTVIITAPPGVNTTATVTMNYTSTSNSATCPISPLSRTFSGYVAAVPHPGTAAYPGSFSRTDIVSTRATYPRAAGRTDCVASTTTCSYSEEMTNFANWWTYYQTRMQTMKTAASRAFQSIDSRYRVGFITIANQNDTGHYLHIAKFDTSQKTAWYSTLFNIFPNTSTPLRSALSTVGRIYAGKSPLNDKSDPMEYSCQQNFALMTTDGYWNSDADSDVKQIDGVTQIGDMDGGSTLPPMYEGSTASSATLADTAKYYYDTDLRDPSLSNCNGALSGVLVCDDNVFVGGDDNNLQQHMTTFTLGLGVDGTLFYTSDYKTAATGDYANLRTAAKSWSVPVADTETAVDDLWHAAVNGKGTYFSAKNPDQLSSGLNEALLSINSRLGAGAAAATSTLNPVAGDNYAYVASYTTVKWTGNLEARSINLTTGVVSGAANWCVENVVSGVCTSPSTQVSGQCVTAGSSAATCTGGGVFDSIALTCSVPLPVTCPGTMAAKVAANTRTIYKANALGTALEDFTYSNLSATQKAYFDGTTLSQWSLLDAGQKSVAAGTNMIEFLRGQPGYEDRSTNPVANRLYRAREATLGDAVESQPAYVGKPYFTYADSGYSSFVTSNAGRAKTVFLGTNDGMMHAFDATTGIERWAYVPTLAIPNMWKLADKNYSSMHTNYVNGKPVIADIQVAGVWKTILVAGLNGGGRGYFALDISDPASPSLLWELSSADEPNMGYSFGPPVVTKKAGGSWVVLLTSGYNNVSPGDGKGYVYIRDAWTGVTMPGSPISTAIGDTTTPSGLAKLTGWLDNPTKDNTATFVYGGDLFGNLWRFDINANSVMNFAVLKDSSGGVQPITTAPELGIINSKRIIYVGTGKYLEISDLTNTQQHTIYAMQDPNAALSFVNPRNTLTQQTLTTSGATRTASANAVSFDTSRGWFVNLPVSGERVNVDPVLDSGLLIVPSTIPSSTVCAPGGTGWLNYFNYETGNNKTAIVSQITNSPIVGVNVFYLPSGQRVVTYVTSTNPTPTAPSAALPQPSTSGFAGKRVTWREYIPPVP
jgi:type IV pilus assembly protein PilY1